MSKPTMYFAYGSNLNQEDLDRWKITKPHHKNLDLRLKKISNGYLPAHRLGFTRKSTFRKNMGVADIIEEMNPDSKVWGVIFEINEAQLKAVQEKEGYPSCYHQVSVEVVDSNGARQRCITYQAVVPDDKKRQFLFYRPHPEYYEVVRKGGEEHGLPKEFFEDLKTASVTQRNPVAMRMNDTGGLQIYSADEITRGD